MKPCIVSNMVLTRPSQPSLLTSGSLLRRSGNHRGSGHHGAGKNETDPNIEQEYISNLQKQVYFLELESKLLREKARRRPYRRP